MNLPTTLSIAQLSTSLQSLCDDRTRPWLVRSVHVAIEELDRLVELFLLVQMFHLLGDVGCVMIRIQGAGASE